MENETFKYDILFSNDFKLIDKDISEYFGDYYKTYSNGEIVIRFSSSQSFKTVDISNVLDVSRWIDLALIKALINDEQNLSKVTAVSEYNDFLENHFTKICDLLSKSNYYTTKKKIEKLEDKRAKQMFPNL
jgi:UDP-N-acetylglucosamine transferase subunit ALG13